MKLYFKYVGILVLKSQMQYKASFIMTTLGQFLVSFTTFLGVYFMFSRFHSINGFAFSEILICFSIILMAFSITECFVRGFDMFPRLIQSGNLDRILVKTTQRNISGSDLKYRFFTYRQIASVYFNACICRSDKWYRMDV